MTTESAQYRFPPVKCIECGKEGTHRVCQECFDAFDQQVQANDAALMAAIDRQEADQDGT